MPYQYAMYLTERTDTKIIELKHGFATYQYLNENQVYLIDIFVLPEFRKGHFATEMAEMIASEAKKKGCKEMIGSVQLTAKNSDASMKVLLAYGMKPYQTIQDGIYFKKELI